MMTAQNLYTSAFLLGLLGGVHCVGMCGGIVAALTFGLPEQVRKRPWAMAPYLVAYNLGRISSYALAGALAGSIGYLAANLVTVHYAQQALRIIAGLFMVILGLYLADWWKGLARLEAIGGLAWRRIEPLGRKLLPVTTPTQAILVGLIWGWLPCGMVYSALVWSMTGGSAVEGALLMLAFGAGTLPTLLSLGAVSATLASIVRKIWLRRVAGALVIGLGGHTVAKVLWESPTHGG
jgi:sulfite exporter TauE/SafE